MNEDELWSSFNLAEANKDSGGGILYCLRYSPEKINAMQETVVDYLKNAGVAMTETEHGIGTTIPKETLSLDKACLLLEELSVLNEAKQWIGIGFGQLNSISELRSHLISTYYGLLEKREMASAYDFVTLIIPEIYRDISRSHIQNSVLSSKDKKELESLVHFTKRQEKILNTSGKYVIIR